MTLMNHQRREPTTMWPETPVEWAVLLAFVAVLAWAVFS
jgi:hypothetical protein